MYLTRVNKTACLLLILAHVSLISCKDNPANPEQTQKPALPPAASMKLDTSLFGSTAAAKAADIQAPGPNFVNAVLRVVIINGVVTLVMAVPGATLAAALSQTPQFGDDGKWHWVFSVTENGNTYQADLAGSIDLENLESVWEMRITVPSANPPLDGFLWYEGRAAMTNKSGVWHIYDAKQPDKQVEDLQIDWSIPSENEANLVFTVVKPGVSENGDTLTYQVKDDNRLIRYFDNSESATVEISWLESTGEGYLIDPKYRNGEKSCWDGQQQDVVCSN